MAERCAGLSASSAPTDAARSAWRHGSRRAPGRDRIRSSTIACEWSEVTITACSSRNRSGPPAACISRSSWRSAAAIEVTCACGPLLVRPRVVVGQREQQEVEQVVLDQVGADAAGVLVAHARHPQLSAAAGLAARVQVGVEQLLGPEDRAPEQCRGDDPRQRRLLGDLMLVAAAVDQVGRAGGADAGVVERLEHGRRVVGEMLRVHPVDRVGQRPQHAELPASPRSSSRTRRSAASTRWYQFMLGIRCSSGPTPVVIVAAQTGVTDGNAATTVIDVHALLRIRSSAGARPARSPGPASPASSRRSRPARASSVARSARSAKDSQARRTSAPLAPRPRQSSHSSAQQRDQAKRRRHDREHRDQQCGTVGDNRQSDRRVGRVEPSRTRARNGREAAMPIAAQITPPIIPGPGRVVVAGERASEDQRRRGRARRAISATASGPLRRLAAQIPAVEHDQQHRADHHHQQERRATAGNRMTCGRSGSRRSRPPAPRPPARQKRPDANGRGDADALEYVEGEMHPCCTVTERDDRRVGGGASTGATPPAREPMNPRSPAPAVDRAGDRALRELFAERTTS